MALGDGETRRRSMVSSGARRWRRRGGRGAPASVAGKRGRRDGEEREKGMGPAGRGAAHDGGGGISYRTAVGRGAAQVLPARGGKGRKGKKIKERRKRMRGGGGGEEISKKNRDRKGIPSLFRDGKQILSLFRDRKKNSVSKIRDGKYSVSI